MGFLALGGLGFIIFVAFLVWYIHRNDKRLACLPKDALTFSPERWTAESTRAHAARLAKSPPISVHEQLPPKTGRRYIVVGGVR